MDIKELNQVSLTSERDHWWIRTRYNYIDRAMKLTSGKNISVAEFGCGSCQNLWYLKKYHKVRQTIGIDPELPENFKFDGMESEDVLARDLNYKMGKPDLILGMDVLEHIENDEEALSKWAESMGESTHLMITVPAFQSLWSHHDVFLDHKRRYTKRMLLSLGKKCGLRPVFSTYAFGPLFPVVWFIRKVLGSGNNESSDLKLPPFFVNLPLRFLGWLEEKLGGTPFFGTSVVCIFKKI